MNSMNGKNLGERILLLLKKQDYSPIELSGILGSPTHSIRGRISELRKKDYNIYLIDGKYHYDKSSIESIEFEDIMDLEALWGKNVRVSNLAKLLSVKHDDVVSFLSKHFLSYDIVQHNNDMVCVNRL